MRPRDAWAIGLFALLVPVFRLLPLPPASAAPVPWLVAVGNAGLLLVAFAAHTFCYARWHPHAPRRIVANELLARLWFAAYGAIVVGRASTLGFAFLLMAVPWALLSWEVHRQEIGKAGYAGSRALPHWGLFLLGLALMEYAALWF